MLARLLRGKREHKGNTRTGIFIKVAFIPSCLGFSQEETNFLLYISLFSA